MIVDCHSHIREYVGYISDKFAAEAYSRYQPWQFYAALIYSEEMENVRHSPTMRLLELES